MNKVALAFMVLGALFVVGGIRILSLNRACYSGLPPVNPVAQNLPSCSSVVTVFTGLFIFGLVLVLVGAVIAYYGSKKTGTKQADSDL